MDRRIAARTLAGLAVTALCAGLVAVAPAQATTASALSKACKKAQTKAIAAEAADPAGQGTAQRAYLKKCPGADYLDIRSIGSVVAFSDIADAHGKPVAVKKVTSSNPKVIALGKPTKQTTGGADALLVEQQAVGLGQSRVCMTPATGKSLCLLVVVPKAVSGGTGRTLNVALGHAGVPAPATSITSSNPAVVTIGVDPSTSRPYTSPVGAGTTTICVQFSKGPGGCQDWTVAS